jgi:hypothetical protein
MIERRKTDRFDNVAEQVYLYAFYGVCAYIVVLTGLIVWQSKSPDNDLQNLVKTILGFVEKMVYVYVFPLALRTSKDALPYLADVISAWRGNNLSPDFNVSNNPNKPPLSESERGYTVNNEVPCPVREGANGSSQTTTEDVGLGK